MIAVGVAIGCAVKFALATPTLSGSGSGPVVRGPSLSDVNFTLNPVERDTYVSGGSTSENTVDDSVYDVTTGATVDKGWELFVEQQNVGQFVQPYFESADESIATVNQQGHVTRVSDGTVAIFARSHFLTRRYDAVVSRDTPVTANVFKRFVNGSVAAAMTDGVMDRIDGKDPSTAKPLYTTQNHTTGTYVRNPNCWITGPPSLIQGITCHAVWTQSSGNKLGFTLISPRHGIMAKHAKVSGQVRFVTADGTTVTRTIANRVDIAGADFTIGVLDEDVPDTISFAKVPPADFGDYIPGVANGIHCVALDQEEHAIVNDLRTVVGAGGNYLWFDIPHDEDAAGFNEAIVVGDSGNPSFAIIGDDLVLLTVWTNGEAGGGYRVWSFLSEINAAMTTLGGGYQLTEIDLSGYTNYGE